MVKEQILTRLQEMQQLHLSAKLDSLNKQEQKQFLNLLSPQLLVRQRETLNTPPAIEAFEPIVEAEAASNVWTPLGTERLIQGKVACLILAGGQGSRLGVSTPKALIPIMEGSNKTLLQLQLEKIQTSSMFHRTKIPCAVITSVANHALIAEFIEAHNFGLSITLVIQDEAPFLDDQGNWILNDDGKLATGPDGNGHALHLLQRDGILNQWKAAGIEEITIVPIDNPLADPTDPVLIGYHASHAADVTIKVIRRSNSEEKVGIIVRKNGRICVQEYSELPSVKSPCLAHIGLFAINLSFAQRVSKEELPWHLARKQNPLTQQMVWKFERFIFDTLVFSDQTNLLLYPREDVYAPLKNATGENSLATVQAALKRLIR
jgi:UDP-N-acetylglucosamine/UDP-N-acetylgalactosamine diphosphorylase